MLKYIKINEGQARRKDIKQWGNLLYISIAVKYNGISHCLFLCSEVVGKPIFVRFVWMWSKGLSMNFMIIC